MGYIKKSLSVVLSLLATTSILGLCGCEQDYKVVTIPTIPVIKAPSGNGPVTPVTPPAGVTPPVVTPPVVVAPPVIVIPVGPNLASNTETFNTTTNQIKKIDFLFVIDNSPSMSDKQKKLAEGFKTFANTFFRRADLDICVMIITSDRYLGKVGRRGYARERALPCTKPAGSESWSDDQMQSHINSLISEFETAANVGEKGSPTELLGKSLASFLEGTNQWGDTPDAAFPSTFFRKDAVANISFLSDENNYYFDSPNEEEAKNDIPYLSNTPIPGAKNGELDPRKGIKEYLDAYFTRINPKRALSYSTTAILTVNGASNVIPGLSRNLSQLTAAVARESRQVDIVGSAQAYSDVYQSIANSIVLRASTFTLSRAAQPGSVSVQVVSVGGERQALASTDFSVENATVLSLNPSAMPLLKDGDRLEVTYQYPVK